MKKKCWFFITLFGSIFFYFGCSSTRSTEKENVSIVNTTTVPQAPSVVDPNQTKQNNAEKITQREKEFKETMILIKEIEENFISQNCTNVLDKAKHLDLSSKKLNYSFVPPLAQTAIYVCDSKAGLDHPERVNKAISVLTGLHFRYPVINEAWLHNTLADFYFALGDKANALSEKRLARDLILAQQLDVSSLNAQILQLNPSEPGLQHGSANNFDGKNQTVDQIVGSASQLLKNDTPEQAIALLDTIPNDQRTDASRRVRSDAVNSLVTNLRYKVRALFVRSTQQTGPVRKETLSQCEQILQSIIKNYPEYTDMNAVQQNLKNVQRELAKP